jgi:NADPH2:quinone reductase
LLATRAVFVPKASEARAMKAIHLNDYGSTEHFRIVDAPKPVPGRGEVLIKVSYAGLRWGDIMQRNGWPSRMRKPPFIPGQEAAGTIESVGPDVTRLKEGMRVMAMPMDGAFAEYLVVPAMRVWPIPDRVSLDQSLVYPVNMRTAYLIVMAWAKVQPGETVLLHSAAGGVGLMALQIMKRRLRQVNVIAVVGSDQKAELARAHGADHCINYNTSYYVDEVTKLVGKKAVGFDGVGVQGNGVDVALNGVSGTTLVSDPKVIRKRGRWVIYGYAGGRAMIDTGPFGYDGITIMPFSSIAWIGTPEYEASTAFVQEWMETEELLKPTVHPLEEVAEVQRAMELGKTSGKIVFSI